MRANSFLITAAFALFGQAAFSQSTGFTVVSAGNWGPITASDSLAAGFGSNFTTQTYSALTVPLPTQLDGVSIQVTDSTKAADAGGMLMVSSGQVNFLVPANAKVGAGRAALTANGGAQMTGNVLISNVAPAIFTANQMGTGVAVGEVFSYPVSGGSSFVYTFTGGANGYSTLPFSLSPSSTQVFLILYGTGIRNHSPNPVEATIGGTPVPVTYAGPVAGFAGLDQLNIGPLPQSLGGTGKGDVPVSVIVDGAPANTVTINIQ